MLCFPFAFTHGLSEWCFSQWLQRLNPMDRIPKTEQPGWLQSMGLQKIRHDWSDLALIHADFIQWWFVSPEWFIHLSPEEQLAQKFLSCFLGLLLLVRLPLPHYLFSISSIFRCFSVLKPAGRISLDFHCSLLLELNSVTRNSCRILLCDVIVMA